MLQIDCGVYFKGIGKDWVHDNNQSRVQADIEDALEFYTQLPLVNVNDLRVSSNFLVFDLASYSPLNSPSNFDQGWLLNGPAFNNWFNYIGQMTKSFGVPGMLWQMSGDPMPVAASMPQWSWGYYYGSMPNFIFGTSYPTSGSNLNPTNPLTLPQGLGSLELGNMYGGGPLLTVMGYSSDNGNGGVFDWTRDISMFSLMQGFSIQFGGATNRMAGISTVSPAPNNGWRLTSVNNYWASPNPIRS